MPETGEPLGTAEVRLVPDEAKPYRRLHVECGEPHAARTELLGGADAMAGDTAGISAGGVGGDVSAGDRTGDAAAVKAGDGAGVSAGTGEISASAAVSSAAWLRVAGLIHFTDFQLADLASPARTEYMQRLEGVPGWERMLPAYRPQEFMLAQAIECMTRAINALVKARPELWNVAVTTGDNLDSAQRNELQSYLTLLDGGAVEPAKGTRGFADAPVGLGDPHYYNPEPQSHDIWKREHGLPDHPGALNAAAAPFATEGLAMPWLSCFGNHDCLVQGRAAKPEGFDEYLAGGRKPVSEDVESAPQGDKMLAYVADPTWAGARGEQHGIVPDPGRAVAGKADYVRAHLASPGLPRGHGFTDDSLRTGTTYYCYDAIDGVRVIALDTTNTAGHVDGCIDDRQFHWLEERLIEVSSCYADASGGCVHTEHRDRLVVLASHHGLSTLNNDYGDVGDCGDGVGAGDCGDAVGGGLGVDASDSSDGIGTGARGHLHLADEVEALLHRFPNVALWLSGHTHVNRITPRPGAEPCEAFWEVSTGSISEWPVQFRCVEFFAGESPCERGDDIGSTGKRADCDGRHADSANHSEHTGDAANKPDGLLAIRVTMIDTAAPASPDGSLSIADLASLHREIAANDDSSVGGHCAEGSRADRNQDLLLTIPAATLQALREDARAD
ncbi:hypothetical protein [Bifidobacterium tibiigranuli]|jgi:metallophosphoesterase (TIGR03767 family)|uniref:hypothetical protein n=1 Tax=Bifidobacterium tibiigranuli TaxID=2172043 RepID=UPI0026EF4F9F|nr:hypothetical protein [Bifidobacterium tibiigranuli]MCI1223413.1 hypothetical protein [Bifidobacterium subtile]MCI1650248.1 hypothetical protein [Bifidobacterium tibiigranuli]MCI2184828.1 hypothetical protein [Bifidobacterium tibiigranuli]MCI2204381.1 hypothetical protein [Bifidobacterium tibiigranuli]